MINTRSFWNDSFKNKEPRPRSGKGMIFNVLDTVFSFYVMVFLEHLHLQCNPKRFASLLQTTQFLLSERALGAPILLTDKVLLISAPSTTAHLENSLL